MKKQFKKALLWGIGTLFSLNSMSQNSQWIIPPYNINMSGGAPSAGSIASATSGSVSNGAFDVNGNLLFYVKDLKVYNGSNSQLIGALPMPIQSGGNLWLRGGSEVEVVRIPGLELCNKFFIIYTTIGSSAGNCLCYAEVDYNSGSPVMTPAAGTTLSSTNYPQYLLQWQYFGAGGLAVSKPLSNNQRYLFTTGYHGDPNYSNASNYGGLFRWTISAGGISNETTIATPLQMGNYFQTPNYLTISQLSLSSDQTRIAWGGATQYVNQPQAVFEVKLTSSYTFNGFYQYNIPTTTSGFIAGVEYSNTNKLYVSNGDGIYCISSFGGTPAFISGSASVGHQSSSYMYGSQLQYMKSTGNIIGIAPLNTSAIAGNLYSINPITNAITNPVLTTTLSSAETAFNYAEGFTLPEQVEGDTLMLPVLSPSISMTSSVVCVGSMPVINGTYTGNTTPDHYYWEVTETDQWGNVISGGYTWGGWTTGAPANPQPIPSIPPLSCDKYFRVTYALQNTVNCLYWAAYNTTIHVVCTPTPNINGTSDLCAGSTTTLCSSYIPSSLYTITWAPAPKATLHNQCITVSPTTNTTYTLTVINTSTGCTGSVTATVHVYNADPDFSYITSYQSPNNYYTVSATPVSTTANGGPGFGDTWAIVEIDAQGNQVAGTNTALGNLPNPNCWWGLSPIAFPGYTGVSNVNCGPPPGYNTPSPTIGQFKNGSTYMITHNTWSNYCSWSTKSHTVTVSGHRDANSSNGSKSIVSVAGESLTIFPNPSRGILNVRLENPSEGAYTVEVFDMYGKLVYRSEKLATDRSGFSRSVDLSSYSLVKGIYLVNLRSDNKVLSQKLIIE